MGISRVHAQRSLLVVIAAAALTVSGCTKDAPAAPPTGGAAQSSTAPPTIPAQPGGTDYCALAESIATQSGIMANKHFVSPLKETREMLEAVVTLSLAAKDQLGAALPDNVKPAFLIEMQYFQMLKDSNYTAAPPAGFDAANKTVNDYGVATCGFVFDQ